MLKLVLVALLATLTIEAAAAAPEVKTRDGMLGFKNFRCARILLSGIEVMHMIKKGQMMCRRGTARSAAEQFYALSA